MKTRSIVGLVVLALLLSGGNLCAQTIAYKDPSAPVEARVKPGQFELSVGSSSRLIRFSQQIVLSKEIVSRNSFRLKSASERDYSVGTLQRVVFQRTSPGN